MDGNGRWARERVMPRTYGHRAGMQSVRDVVEGAIEVGLETLSLFAFSKENWQRPKLEVSALMSLLEEYIQREADALDDNGVRVRVLGEIERLTPPAAAAVSRVTAQTAHNTRLDLNLFISYGARAELVRAARLIAEDVAAGRLDPGAVDEAEFAGRLYTAGMPDPDLLIRTSGELRISNFMLWQLAYTELYVSPVLWPDFRRAQFYEAILAFQNRDRRFGKVSV
ncbi:MAG: di-trans,poly-cis-decaprenylcistransferase [Gemmatimonadota bacterium]|nr:di-trans,poly-cis-decaprenylcistransferase [Gemmatimonadota bacterium]